jgi:hypothetical protein
VVVKLTQSQREWQKKPPMELRAFLWSMTIAQLKTFAQTHKIDLTGATDRDAAVMLLYSKLHSESDEEGEPEGPEDDEAISDDTSACRSPFCSRHRRNSSPATNARALGAGDVLGGPPATRSRTVNSRWGMTPRRTAPACHRERVEGGMPWARANALWPPAVTSTKG